MIDKAYSRVLASTPDNWVIQLNVKMDRSVVATARRGGAGHGIVQASGRDLESTLTQLAQRLEQKMGGDDDDPLRRR